MVATDFGGRAGEEIRGLCTPRGIATLLPLVLLTLGLGVAGLVIAAYALPASTVGQVLAVLVATSPVLGREALVARSGQSPTAAEVMLFASRFSALALVWGAPFVLIWPQLEAAVVAAPAPGIAQGWLLVALWPRVIASCLVGGAGGMTAVVALVMAARVENAGELFTTRAWGWLLGRGARQLPALGATLIGGVALHYLALLPGILLLALGAARLGGHAGVVVALFGYLSPLAAGGILGARLAGALAGQGVLETEPHRPSRPETIPLSPEARAAEAFTPLPLAWDLNGPEPSPALRPGGGRSPELPGAGALDLIQAIQGLAARADSDLPAAISEAEQLFANHPGSAGALGELAKLYRRAGDQDRAVATVARAITLALRGGMSPVALDLFRAFAAERERLELSVETLTALGRSLRFRGASAEADWCEVRAAARASGG